MDKNICSSCNKQFMSPVFLNRHKISCMAASLKSPGPMSPASPKSYGESSSRNMRSANGSIKKPVLLKRLFVQSDTEEPESQDELENQIKGAISNRVQNIFGDTKKVAKKTKLEFCDKCMKMYDTSAKHTCKVTKKQAAAKGKKKPVKKQPARKGKRVSFSPETLDESSKTSNSFNDSNNNSTVAVYNCKQCQESFAEISDYYSHVGKHKIISCPECDFEASSRDDLVQHMGIHITEKKYSCDVCSKQFSRKYHLDRHVQMTTCSGQPTPVHPCEVCGKVYTRKDNLQEHLRAHAGEVSRRKKYKCEYCSKCFHGTSLLKIHIRTHTGERPFQCEFCIKSFPSGGALTKHRRIHTGEKPYGCTDCGIMFSLKGTLNRHMRIHTGVRPHKCQFCGKQFIQAGGLKAHLFYHTGQNGYACHVCGKIFNRKARLQMHIRYVHDKLKPFECLRCDKSFTRKEDLSRHYILHTGEKPHECPTCHKRFAIKPSLKLHLLTHTKEEPRSCHECGRAFIRKDCLVRHMRKRHRDLLDKILVDEKDQKFMTQTNLDGISTVRVMEDETLCDSIRELLSLLVDENTLKGFGWPDKPVDELLECVIKRCGHNPVRLDDYSYMDRLRENSKLLFTVVIDDNAVKTLLNNQTVDEVILHVLRLAKS